MTLTFAGHWLRQYLRHIRHSEIIGDGDFIGSKGPLVVVGNGLWEIEWSRDR